MNPALVLTTTAEITAGPYLLRASGSRVVFDGFARAYSTTLIEETGPDASKLPALAVNDSLAMKEILPEQHFTEPPPHYTEATLVKTLEEKGIGRPSTYATIVSTILSRDYVTRDRGKLVPTELGMTVWKLLGKMFNDVFDVEFTARLETQLDRIETGRTPGATSCRGSTGRSRPISRRRSRSRKRSAPPSFRRRRSRVRSAGRRW